MGYFLRTVPYPRGVYNPLEMEVGVTVGVWTGSPSLQLL